MKADITITKGRRNAYTSTSKKIMNVIHDGKEYVFLLTGTKVVVQDARSELSIPFSELISYLKA